MLWVLICTLGRMKRQVLPVLAVVLCGLVVVSCGSDDEGAVGDESATTATSEPATSAVAGEPASGRCETGPGGFVDDEPAGVPAGLDVVSAEIRSDGEDLVATITLAGPHTELGAEAPGEGFWFVHVGAESWAEYQVSASLIDGQEEYSVFDSEAGERKPVDGVMAGSVVTITAPLELLPGFGPGWVWSAGSEAGYMTVLSDLCPGPEMDSVLEVGAS